MNRRWAVALAILSLALLFVALQYRLWLSGEASPVWEAQALKRQIAEQRQENARLAECNERMRVEISDLKRGRTALEERARNDLGMVKEGETYVHVIEEAQSGPPAKIPIADTCNFGQ